LLNGTFNCTRVIGQFATQKTYSIEYNRCIRARGSDPSETSLFKKAARKSWRIIVRLMHMTTNITRLVHDSHSISDFKDTHSLKDIFYKSTDLDNALTLVACCSVDEIISADAVRSFETL